MTPTTAIDRFDLSLRYGEFDSLMNRLGMIGHRVLPPIVVGQKNADFLRVKIASFLNKIEETKRAPKSTYSRKDFEFDTDNYLTDEHGVEEVVDDAEIERYGDIIRVERMNTLRAYNRLCSAYEAAVASAVFNTTIWTGAALTSAAGTAWSTKATADPVANIDAAIEKVEAGCGMTPNTLIVTKKALRNLLRTDRIEDLLKHAGFDDPKKISNNLPALAQLLNLEQVLVANGYKNTADDGQTASLSRFWDDTKAMVAHVHNDGMDGDLESPVPNIGRTIMWDTQVSGAGAADDPADALGIVLEEYREENRRGGVLRARSNYQVKRLHVEAGHLITGVL
jgi:hypothetical protein